MMTFEIPDKQIYQQYREEHFPNTEKTCIFSLSNVDTQVDDTPPGGYSLSIYSDGSVKHEQYVFVKSDSCDLESVVANVFYKKTECSEYQISPNAVDRIRNITNGWIPSNSAFGARIITGMTLTINGVCYENIPFIRGNTDKVDGIITIMETDTL